MHQNHEMPQTGESNDVLSIQLRTMHNDVSDIKVALRDLTAAITKWALIEERQVHANIAQERMAKQLEDINARVLTIERQAPGAARVSEWMDRGLWACAAAALMYVAKKVGLI